MRKRYGLLVFVFITTLALAACGGGGGGGSTSDGGGGGGGGGGTGVTLGTLISQSSLTVNPVLSFAQNIASKDTGTINTYGEFFPGQANVWTLDADFALLDGYDNQFDYALFMNVVSNSTTSTFFPNDQLYSDLTFYTPVMGTADGVKTAVVSDGKTNGMSDGTSIQMTPTGMSTDLAPLEGTYSAYLNATSGSSLQQTVDLTALSTNAAVTLTWKDRVSYESGPFFGYDARYRVVAYDVSGATTPKVLYTFTGTNPTSHSVDLGSYALGGKNIKLSFEFRSMTAVWMRAYAIIDAVSVKDLSNNEYVVNGDFETTHDLTGWTANTPAEVMNVTSAVRALEGLNVKRSFYTKPNNLWARWVDVFENTTASDITRTIEYETGLGSMGAGIIYYSTGTSSKALTSWDGAAEDRDVGLVFGNATTVNITGASALDVHSYDGTGLILVSYNITVPANGRVAIVNFVILGSTDTGQTATDINARATEIDTEAKKIVDNFWTDVQYREGMTQEQIDAIKNF